MAQQEHRTDSAYAEHVAIHPRAVKGAFRTVKWWLMVISLAVWYLAPFLRWDRGPGAPDQAILVDLGEGRAYFFFLEIWPQEVYYITGILLFSAILLFFMSALAGRVWCGFLCWQTVFTDLFVQVERWVIGDRNARIALDRQPWTGSKIAKMGLVNLIWLLISLATGISFTLFFGNAPTVLENIFTGQASIPTYAFIAIIGGGCFLLAGYAREQVCIYMCPYARFQSAMFDEHSLIISYETWRGEPRGPAKRGDDFSNRGDCVDCRMCVVSCPTGIDIRDGTQLACIGCGLCIDACNAIMDKFGRPRGLISYDSQANLDAKARGEKTRVRPVRLRTILYVLLLLFVGGVIAFGLSTRSTTEWNILHERSPMFVQMSDGTVRNGYTMRVINKIREDRHFTLSTRGIDGAVIEVIGDTGTGPSLTLDLPGDHVGTFRLYVSVPQGNIKESPSPLEFVLTDNASGQAITYISQFYAP